jgi:hypothetical protein
MGRGDSRRTPKVRQRKAWRKAKARLAAKIAGTGKKASAPKAAAKPAGSTVTKKKATKE